MRTHQKEMMALGFSKKDARALLHLADQRARKDLRRFFGHWPDNMAPGMRRRVARERRVSR